MSHFLAPIVALARAAYARRYAQEIGRGADPRAAHERAAQQVSDALSALDIDGSEISAILRAVYEMERADRRGVRLGVNRALTIAFSAVREDALSSPSSVGFSPVEIYRRGELSENGEVGPSQIERLPVGFAARTPIMRRACPTGAYQSGWSRGRVLAEAARAGRVLP